MELGCQYGAADTVQADLLVSADSLRSDSGGSQELPAVAMPVYSCNAHTVAEQLIVGVE